MARSLRQVVSMVALVASLAPLQACAPAVYFAKATYGTVVDSETKRPIAGAVVVATWDMLVAGIGSAPGHGTRGGLLHIAETATDEKGQYQISGWGPKLRPCFAWLDSSDPVLLVFKSGYRHRRLYNEARRNTWIRVSDWNGRVIEIEPFRGLPEERLRDLDFALPGIGPGQIRALYDEILRERKSLEPAGESFFRNVERLREKGD